jgi:hypothetical protein
MGRHARLVEREALFEAFEGPDEHVPPARKHRWISRIPLLPAVAAVGALGVVLAAYGTQQISLNFSDGDNSRADQAAAPQRRDAIAPGAQGGNSGNTGNAAKGASRVSAVTVSFRASSKWPEGFGGSATIVNVSGRTINGWTFAFRLPNARVLSIWEVQVVRLGNPVVVRNPAQAPAIAPGDTVRIGFTARGAAGTPSACTFNGVRCHIV